MNKHTIITSTEEELFALLKAHKALSSLPEDTLSERDWLPSIHDVKEFLADLIGKIRAIEEEKEEESDWSTTVLQVVRCNTSNKNSLQEVKDMIYS